MACVGCDEIQPPIYMKFVEKNRRVRTNGRLESGLVYFY